MSNEVCFEIVEEIAAMPKDKKGGWGLEVNLMSWNNKEPGIDIRWWKEHKEKCGRGVNISRRDAEILYRALGDYLKLS